MLELQCCCCGERDTPEEFKDFWYIDSLWTCKECTKRQIESYKKHTESGERRMNIVELMKVAKEGDNIKMNISDVEETYLVCRVDLMLRKALVLEDGEINIVDRYSLDRIICSDYEIIEPKYFLKSTWLNDCGELSGYINRYTTDNRYFISDNEECDTVQTKFTQNEIEDIKKEYGVTLDDFVKELAE